MSDRVRVASVQYWIRPVESFRQFADQVRGLVETAKDYKVGILVFPEYFTVQLLTLGDLRKPIQEQVRDLARQRDSYLDLMASMAKEHGIYMLAGTMPTIDDGEDAVYNRAYFFSPRGEFGCQSKLHMTRWEKEDWLVTPGSRLHVFDTDFGKMAIAVCYDVEFPEIARAAAREGCDVLLVPSCTDERQGYLRVRYCAQARAVENQMYVVHACTVGSLPMVPAVSLNYGLASILTPSDFPFARDGIVSEGNPNQEMMVIGDLNLETIRHAREDGTVLPLRDSETTAQVLAKLEVETL